MSNKTQSQYKETQILTATPEKLLLMLYDAAILSLDQSIELLQKIDKNKFYDKINNHLVKAQEIVGELMATLDLEQGGEIASNLQSLYGYFLKKIMEGNVNKDFQPLQEISSFLKELRNSWQQAVDEQIKEQAKNKKITPAKSGGLNISG